MSINDENRELDALVAEKVMNLKPCSSWKEIYGGWLAGECWMHEGEPHDNCFNVESPPKFSTEISWTWEVVEKINEDDEVRERFIELLPDKKNFFDKSKANASTIICRAALEAIRISSHRINYEMEQS